MDYYNFVYQLINIERNFVSKLRFEPHLQFYALAFYY